MSVKKEQSDHKSWQDFHSLLLADMEAELARRDKENKRRMIKKSLVTVSCVVIGTFFLILSCAALATEKNSCSNKSERAVRACIWHAAREFNQSYPDALRVARCESKLKPKANKGKKNPHKGLFQFNVLNTWNDSRSPYRNRNVYSAKWSALAAMWFWQQGEKGRWACQ